MRAENFVSELRSLSFNDVFNPYSDRCLVHDKIDAPRKRAKALGNSISAATETDVDAIWIGRDLGHRGGRRTGLALTDDIHITAYARRWGLTLERPTIGQPVAEQTAAIVWGVLNEIQSAVFLWNVFPFHPHEPNNPFTNRIHNAHERAVGEELLSELILLLRPRKIVAIGNDAARSASRVASGMITQQVRHPSYGGKPEFLAQMTELYPSRSERLL